ncbi:hypothetical protein [Ralstonia phage RP31]|uniref:Uncharacterized protein n=2 Tax=Ripduovirus RP12 TaxID=2560700 RepID=A0A1L7N118_9CAUD|nr:hypothetical protein FDH28_gp225 [Ralstonia phage RP12]BAW19170.1 hypothetical protein [Ralstonia phage RP12]BAW19456.1 hypothetical protein [Ralstonia phage RP31]
MATKAGQLKYKDIRNGKTGWWVQTLTYDGKLHTLVPIKVFFTEKPWTEKPWFHKDQNSHRMAFLSSHLCITRMRHIVPANYYGISIPPFSNKGRGAGFFTTKAAAERYQKRLNMVRVDLREFEAINDALMEADFQGRLFSVRDGKKHYFAKIETEPALIT